MIPIFIGMTGMTLRTATVQNQSVILVILVMDNPD
jgi:hypothetical protein